MNEQKANELFDSYINGNISYFKNEIRKLNKRNLLKCIDILIDQYGYKFGNDEKDIFRIFYYHLITG